MNSLIILAALFSMTAFSQEKAAPCRSDIVNFCSGISGKRNIVACLRQNSKDLSPTCKAQFVEAKAALKDCKADMKKICKTAVNTKGAMLKCLKDNSDKIGPACKAHVDRQ